MQNICKTLRSIDMKKIKKYVVFKYEDEFGFHYMVMGKLPGETLWSEKMIGPVVGWWPHNGDVLVREDDRPRGGLVAT